MCLNEDFFKNPPVITIFIGDINHSQMGSLCVYYCFNMFFQHIFMTSLWLEWCSDLGGVIPIKHMVVYGWYDGWLMLVD